MAGPFKPAFFLPPKEIRDRIYLYVILGSIRKPPRTPDESGKRSTDSRDRYCPSHVAYELHKLSGIVPSLGLLRCCHQTRFELQEFIRREDTNARKEPLYQLDCMLSVYRIFPTWILLPTSLSYVHRLQITIRAFHMHQEGQELLILFPEIFDLLYRLFNLGPHFYRCDSERFPVFIDTLILQLVDQFPMCSIRLQEGTSVSFERVWQCISGLAQYGLLQGKVNAIGIHFRSDVKVVQVNSSTGKAATCGQWLAWKKAWLRDPRARQLDAY